MWLKIKEQISSRENWLALCLCLVVVLLIIFTASIAPTWIYQGF